jgi:hypothetical protein
VSSDLRAFFEAFERNNETGDLRAAGSQFADVFMSADPGGVVAVPRGAFLAALPKRAELFRAAGIERVRLVSVKETELDPLHTMARTEWSAEKADGGSLTLVSTYILRRDAGSYRVVFYLNHQDLAAMFGQG